jgi:hypothetical protein
MSSNGRLKASELSRITGGGFLRKDAARAWNAFAHYVSLKGQSVQVTDSYRPLGKPGDLKRGVWSQVAAWERYTQGGNLAAKPGTSNHGWGLAVDVPGGTQDLIRKYGSDFGFSKASSDAPSEPWHFKWKAGKYPAVNKYGVPANTHKKSSEAVRLKKSLRVHGFWPKAYPINSGFGPRTAAQVRKFQAARHLPVTGKVDGATWKALAQSPPKPVTKPHREFFADIYEGDENVNLGVYAKAGHKLIALKASEGRTYHDHRFVERWNAAGKQGLTRWAYHFARPSNNRGSDEARSFASALRQVQLTANDRLVLDWEDPKYSAPGEAWIAEFIAELQTQGFELRVLYSYGSYLSETVSRWPSSKSGPVRYWHAAYTQHPESNIPSFAKPHLRAVQFTDGQSGVEPRKAAGIGPCDINYLV